MIPSLDTQDFHRLLLACNRQNIRYKIQVGVSKLMNRQYIYTYFSHLQAAQLVKVEASL